MNLGGSIKIKKCSVFGVLTLLVVIIYILSPSGDWSLLPNNSKSQKVNLRKLVIGLILAAKSGGKEVVKVSKDPDFGIESKGKTKEGGKFVSKLFEDVTNLKIFLVDDPVTRADVFSHCAIAYGLWRIFPKLHLISEENVQEKSCPEERESFDLDPTVLSSVELPSDIDVSVDDIAVWIDPLDATKEYTESLFHYVSTMICVAVKGEPVIGVVHFPFNQKTYWAWKDHGVSENLANLKVVSPDVAA